MAALDVVLRLIATELQTETNPRTIAALGRAASILENAALGQMTGPERHARVATANPLRVTEQARARLLAVQG